MHWWSRQSLAVKVPLVLVSLLLAAFAMLSAMMYFETRATLLSVASGRLGHAAGELAEVLAASARQRATLLSQFRGDDSVRQLLMERGPSPPALERFTERARLHLGASVSNARLDVWDREGRLLGSIGADFPPVAAGRVMEMMAGGPNPATGSLTAHSARVSYSTWVVIGDVSKPTGLISERRYIVNQSTTTNLLATLIGEDATVVIANADGTVWTNLGNPVPQPPVSGLHTTGMFTPDRPGFPATIARAVPIEGTPWVSVVELPIGHVLTPVEQLIKRAAGLTVILAIAAALLGWIAARRVIAPLREVTAAAESVAASRPVSSLTVNRSDEIGRLAQGFNVMAANVAASRSQYEELVHQLEERVKTRTADLETANRELEAFSYSVSHDLRAPLRAISGFVQILLEDAKPDLSEEAQAHLTVIHRNAKRMGELIDDLLSFSRVGRQALSTKPVDIAALASRVAADVMSAEPERHLTIHVGRLPVIDGDEGLLRQVLENLLQNAAKFTRRQAEARIEVGTVDVEGTPALFVADNGAGFDMQYADKLFGVFQRLHRAEDFEGTGVGLAIVHRIITRHGGRVWATGAVEEGATFYFTLPLTEANHEHD
jgi:signal transduction histidine kinase